MTTASDIERLFESHKANETNETIAQGMVGIRRDLASANARIDDALMGLHELAGSLDALVKSVTDLTDQIHADREERTGVRWGRE